MLVKCKITCLSSHISKFKNLNTTITKKTGVEVSIISWENFSWSFFECHTWNLYFPNLFQWMNLDYIWIYEYYIECLHAISFVIRKPDFCVFHKNEKHAKNYRYFQVEFKFLNWYNIQKLFVDVYFDKLYVKKNVVVVFTISFTLIHIFLLYKYFNNIYNLKLAN